MELELLPSRSSGPGKGIGNFEPVDPGSCWSKAGLSPVPAASEALTEAARTSGRWPDPTPTRLSSALLCPGILSAIPQVLSLGTLGKSQARARSSVKGFPFLATNVRARLCGDW